MPIMDGLEACQLIYNYLNQVEMGLTFEQPLAPSRVRKSPTLIYCLSADYSPETHQLVKALPFDDFISIVKPDAILKEVEKMEKTIKDSLEK